MERIINNREFAKADTLFNGCCQAMKIKPTKRQASKWRNEKGLAYKFKNEFEKDNTNA